MTDQQQGVEATGGQGAPPDKEGPGPNGSTSDGTGAREKVSEQTVEEVVRGQLGKALGGKRGMLEAAVPTVAFTLTYIIGSRYGLGDAVGFSDVQVALGLGVGAALVLGAIRLVQRSSVQFVANSLFGIGIAAVFALRSGQAEDAFLPGIIYNAVYAVVLIFSILVRWPVMGLLIGAVTGDPTGWRSNPAVVRLSSQLTWLFVLPCVIRVLVQYPLWASGMVGWLGASKILMGWPLQVAALAAMVWLLARGRTPIEPVPEERTA
ncbi:DUF3159 domain-containing protein [Nocardiopsis ansamitocini]|uniref:DUF3159 domain-containing protein n=1 Tax=Nocardiopsis ansamitocini TaxID=1670832 RepID=A0A9W6UJT2_9ACTN|nr:DUF3159 domain-containing protein [Nocardiopsis ansamitocini]GLU49022.1 hypothetical protein Nans01_33730 [Nocardiopsis ansamitocini]